jgi:hypothetical protein
MNYKDIVELKVDQPCTSCGAVCTRERRSLFDWHHRNPEEKEFSPLADGPHSEFSNEAVAMELEKCDLVCRDCHKMIHYGGVPFVAKIPIT